MLKTLAVCLSAISFAYSKDLYPVPTPAGGRNDVHGWLILPIEIDASDDSRPLTRPAWFSHHVPEFFHDSPHNFQIIFLGTISPTPAVAPSPELSPLNLPLPPLDDLLTFEYSITPPSPFSLNDLLNHDIKSLYGVYYNGSFDTPYDRIPESLSVVKIEDLTTAVYLDEAETSGYTNLTYLSYPRALPGISKQSSDHFYLAHSIRAQPDFDHVAHGRITNCSSTTSSEIMVTKALNQGGLLWEVPGVANTLENKLKSGDVFEINTVGAKEPTLRCQLVVLESIHCMIGPGFMENC